MPKKRWFRFYIDQWRGGVRGLKPNEIAVYITVLCELYDNEGFIELDASKLSRDCGMRPARFEAVVQNLIKLGKLNMQSGFLTNSTVSEEIVSREKFLKKERNRRRQNDQTLTKHEPTVNHVDADYSIKSMGGVKKTPHNTYNNIKKPIDCASLTEGVCGTKVTSLDGFIARQNARKRG